jgi:fluoroacetyl-CoA thioesterase
MNFDTLLKIGDTNINEYIVKQENTADFLGNEGVTVLSTPSMIGFMEATAAQIVTTKLPDNYRPVGTKINIEHISSTPVNTKVTIKATLMTVTGRKLRFKVEAFNEKYKIGFGEYEQHIINLDEFLNKR